MEGTSPNNRTIASMTIFSAASTSSDDSQNHTGKHHSRKKIRIKKEEADDEEILPGTNLIQNQQQVNQQLLENSILGNVNNLPMDLNIDTQANLDFMNNQLIMQAICK